MAARTIFDKWIFGLFFMPKYADNEGMRSMAFQKGIRFAAALVSLLSLAALTTCDTGGGPSNVLYSDEIGDIVQTLSAVQTLTVPPGQASDKKVLLIDSTGAEIGRVTTRIMLDAGYTQASAGLPPEITILVNTEKGIFTEEHRARVGAALQFSWKELEIINNTGGETAYCYVGTAPETVIKTEQSLELRLPLAVEHVDLPLLRDAYRGAVTVAGGSPVGVPAGDDDFTAAGRTLTMRTAGELTADITIPVGLILATGANTLSTGGHQAAVHGTFRIDSGGRVTIPDDEDDSDGDGGDAAPGSVWDFLSASSRAGGRVEVAAGGVLRLGESTRGYGGAGFDYALGSNALLRVFIGTNRLLEQEFTRLAPGAAAVVTVQHPPEEDDLLLDITTTVGRGVTLTVSGGKTLRTAAALVVEDGAVLSAAGRVVVEPSGAVVLRAAEEDGGRLTGSGAVEAGAAEITGGANGWLASGSPGFSVSIRASGSASSITGSGRSVFTAAGTGARITQKALPSNNLTIGADTTIALRGTNAKAGELILKGSADTPARLSFTGGGGTGVPASARLTTGYFGMTPVFEAASAASIEGLTGTAAVWGAARTGDTGKLAELSASLAGQYLQAQTADISLSSETAVSAVP